MKYQIIPDDILVHYPTLNPGEYYYFELINEKEDWDLGKKDPVARLEKMKSYSSRLRAYAGKFFGAVYHKGVKSKGGYRKPLFCTHIMKAGGTDFDISLVNDLTVPIATLQKVRTWKDITKSASTKEVRFVSNEQEEKTKTEKRTAYLEGLIDTFRSQLAEKYGGKIEHAQIESLSYSPSDYQQEGVNKIYSHKDVLLEMEVGTGKTKTALWGAKALLKNKVGKRMLVVCEKKNKEMWEREAKEEHVPCDVLHFEFIKKLCTIRVKGKGRSYAYNHANDFLDLSKYEVIVIDESHLLANVTQNAKALIALIKDYQGESVLSLTGTAYRNTIADYYIQLAILRHPVSAISFNDFKNLFRINFYQEPRQDLLKELMDDMIFFKTQEMCGLEFSYDYLQPLVSTDDNFLNEMQEIKDNAKMIKLKNGAGAMINTSVIKIQSLLAKHKVKWTLEYIKAHPEEKAIVISNYNKDVLDFLGEVLEVDVYKGATKNKQDMVDSFNNGEFNVFLGQRKVAETGLNVQTATTLIVNDMHWSLASMIQIMGRIKRRGQKNHFKILMPVVEGTLDQQILKRLESKHNEYRSFHGIEDGIQLGEIRSRLDRDTGLEIRHELIRELLS